MKVLKIIGSSFGNKTRIATESIEFSENVEVKTIDLSKVKLAYADGRDYREYDDITKDVVEDILAADALLIATPIYNASIPGVLKNVLDLLPVDSIKDKTIGIIVTAGTDKHYLVAQYHLIPILQFMKASVVNRYVFMTNESFVSNQLVDDDIYFRLRSLSRDIESNVTSVKKALEARYDF